MQDSYSTFYQLVAFEKEGRDYSREAVDRDTGILILAPHGGGIEQGTSEIAQAVAGDRLSLYCFNGLKRTANRKLHITSTQFDEPAGLRLVRKSDLVVSIHGLEGEDEAVYVGGLDSRLKIALIEALNSAGFEARKGRACHAGVRPSNVCNRGAAGRGVQLEITRGLRRAMFQGLDRQGRRIKRPVFHHFAVVVQDALLTEYLHRGTAH